jgi:hypothetical protein
MNNMDRIDHGLALEGDLREVMYEVELRERLDKLQRVKRFRNQAQEVDNMQEQMQLETELAVIRDVA